MQEKLFAKEVGRDMGDWMSTAEAGAELGVNRQRVVALIQAGKLDAEKVGRSYIVSRKSVERRKAEGAKSGNPNIKPGYSPRWVNKDK